MPPRTSTHHESNRNTQTTINSNSISNTSSTSSSHGNTFSLRRRATARMPPFIRSTILRVRSWLSSRPWLLDGLLLGTTVATVSLTSALGFSSAVVKVDQSMDTMLSVSSDGTGSSSSSSIPLDVASGAAMDGFHPVSAHVTSLNMVTLLFKGPALVWNFFFNSPSASAVCHECRALRYAAQLHHSSGNGAAAAAAIATSGTSTSHVATLLNFSTDSIIAETFMSFLISFVIVTFSVFVVREMR